MLSDNRYTYRYTKLNSCFLLAKLLSKSWLLIRALPMLILKPRRLINFHFFSYLPLQFHWTFVFFSLTPFFIFASLSLHFYFNLLPLPFPFSSLPFPLTSYPRSLTLNYYLILFIKEMSKISCSSVHNAATFDIFLWF